MTHTYKKNVTIIDPKGKLLAKFDKSGKSNVADAKVSARIEKALKKGA